MYQLLFSPQAKKDAKKHQSSGLKPKVMELLQIYRKRPASISSRI
jgi:mRNA-degrading endonuclease RelE of RelBE toxin-antitoxin system